MKKMLNEIQSVIPRHTDGTMVTSEEARLYINKLPINENASCLTPIQIDCSIEEYAKRTGAIFMDDFNEMVDNYGSRT